MLHNLIYWMGDGGDEFLGENTGNIEILGTT